MCIRDRASRTSGTPQEVKLSVERPTKTFCPDRVLSYFRVEWLPLTLVTVSGLVYNIGLLATQSKGPTRRGRPVAAPYSPPALRRCV